MGERTGNGSGDAGPANTTARGVGLSLFEDLLLLGGVVSVTVGLWWKDPAVALVVLGAMLIVGGMRIGKRS